MEDFYAQILGGAIASIVGGLVGFWSAVHIQKINRNDQINDARRLRLLDGMSKLHEIYSKLYPNDFCERSLSDSDHRNADFVMTLLIIEHNDLWKGLGYQFSLVLSEAMQEIDDSEKRDIIFRKFDSALVDLLNEIQKRLKLQKK
ncbi:hypothetical protein [Rheinheimera baltica]|uniref:hypothetical protein n=1 Tax=Rheinheimera baltica TaxID=67576 RepID=UPI000417DAED|nr:hypothetical protein [Rheinheimera baltica]